MHPTGTSTREEIVVRVTDPGRSRAFYQDLFGLETAPESEWEDQVLKTPEGAPQSFSLRLLSGEREGPAGDLWLSVEVQSVTEVLDLYLLGIMIGAKASLPRKRGDRWNTVVTDPDGHHISIWAAAPEEAERPPVRRSPRWEWERAQRPGYDAGASSREIESEGDTRREREHPGMAPGGGQVARRYSRTW